MRNDDALYCPDECESMAKVAGPESRRKETQAGIISGQHLKEFSRMRTGRETKMAESDKVMGVRI